MPITIARKKYFSEFISILVLALTCFYSQPVFSEGKVSFKSFAGKLQQASEIPKFFKSTQVPLVAPSPELLSLLKTNAVQTELLRQEFEKSTSFERGVIEDAQVMNELTLYLQMTLLNVRMQAAESDWKSVQRNTSAWFLFAADFPYEESSLVGLRFAGVVRAILLDELELIQQKYSGEIAKTSDLRKWFQRVRAPWPVDRVIVSEAKRVLKGPYQTLASGLAKAYQKNPYQSAEVSLKKLKGGGSEGAKRLAQFWRDGDIEAMKTEVNRISKLKIRFAKAEFEFQQKKAAAKVEELVKAGFLDQVPTDYFTGRPLDLTSL